MDQVLGNEHMTIPSIIISPISNTLILEVSTVCRSLWTSTTPFPVSQSNTEDSSQDPFSTCKRVKQKKNDKGEAPIKLMTRGLEIKESEVKQRKQDRETEIK